MRRLSWTQVCARRLQRHSLTTPSPDLGPANIAAAICGAHAQVLSAAELSIGLRIEHCTQTDVRDALWTERSLVKTYGPRGTVHLMSTQDIPLWTSALSAIPSSPSPFGKDVQLTSEQSKQVIDAISLALAEDDLTIDELSEAVVAHAGAWAGDKVMPAFQDMWPRWRQAVTPAANAGALCFGPSRGRKVTYASPRRVLPDFESLDGEKALDEVVRRYLTAYGPATPAHFAQWIGAPRAWAGKLFESMADHLERVDFEGTDAWVVAGDTQVDDEPVLGVRLLPYFDAFTVGSQPRELLFPGVAATRALAGGQAGNFPVMLVDGVVAGVWHLRRSGRKLAITVESLGSLTTRQRTDLGNQVERIGKFFGGTVSLTMGTVTTGAHA